MWCKACGYKLGNPEEDLHDPKGEYIEELGVVENPDSHHIQVVYGEKGLRTKCAETGHMTKLLDHPPEDDEDKGSPSGAGGPNEQPSPNPQPTAGGVYDLEEEKDAEDVLEKVIGNPAYELNEEQIAEVMSWAEIYDGRIPADMVEDILGNLSGVSNQKATLMRQKYEALMNKWLQEQTSDAGGPAIGRFSPPTPSPQGGGRGRRRNPQHQGGQQQPQPSNGQGAPQLTEEQERKRRQKKQEQLEQQRSRRQKRENRREKVVDEFAEEMAKNMASDAGRFYSDMRNVVTTVLKRKAEKDPDWFLEKADQFGMDIISELSEPSDAMKGGDGVGQSQAEADAEIDQIMQEMGQQPQPSPNKRQANQTRQPQQPQQQNTAQTRQSQPENTQSPPTEQPQSNGRQQAEQPETTESPKSEPDPTQHESNMKASPEPEQQQKTEEDEMFEQLMGDVSE